MSVVDGELLTKPFLEEEVKRVVWECEGGKSPGPDGFGVEFYKDCWDIVKEDLVREFSELHDNGKLARGCNSSFIALIPKKVGANDLNQFHPISLIGSLYRILAKVLAEGLKMVIGRSWGSHSQLSSRVSSLWME